MRKSIQFREGQIRLIPGAGNLFFPALIARKNSEFLLLYIFDPEHPGNAIPGMDKQKILMVALCSACTINENRWPLVEHRFPCEREAWPVPVIATADEQENKHYALMYNDELKMEFRLRISREVAIRMQGSGIYSAETLEKKLNLQMNNCFPGSVASYPASHRVA